MKFILQQEKLVELLEKLSLVDVFPSSIIGVKKGENGKPVMFSIQREQSGRIIRYLKVNDTFFDKIETPKKQEAIDIDAVKISKAIKKFAGRTVEVATIDDKLSIKGVFEDIDDKDKVVNKRELALHFNYSEPQNVTSQLSIKFQDGTPHVGKDNKVPLSVETQVNLEDLKMAVELASVFDTEYFSFSLPKKDKLTIRVGNLRKFSEFLTWQPKFKLTAGEEYKSVYTFGFKQLVDVLRKDDITMRTASGAPAWVYEITDDYTLGVLIPPHVPTEEEVAV